MIRINIGCGRTPTPGWENFDNSLSIKISKLPFLFFCLKKIGLLNNSQIENIEWNKSNHIKFADATKIPFGDDSVDVIYSSHMFEHLSPDEARAFLLESKRVLKKGGILRIAIPDLRKHIERYIENGDADEFMRNTYISAENLTSVKSKLRLLIVGFRHHQWMYDGKSLSKITREMGFKETFVLDAGDTKIDNYRDLNLFERSNDSVYVEAIK